MWRKSRITLALIRAALNVCNKDTPMPTQFMAEHSLPSIFKGCPNEVNLGK
ncbi:TPA: hypothetical protein ACTXXA_002543 [Legionella anisa]